MPNSKPVTLADMSSRIEEQDRAVAKLEREKDALERELRDTQAALAIAQGQSVSNSDSAPLIELEGVSGRPGQGYVNYYEGELRGVGTHGAISFVDDAGYNASVIAARVKSLAELFNRPDVLGKVDRRTRANDFSNLPRFDPLNRLHVQVWIERRGETEEGER